MRLIYDLLPCQTDSRLRGIGRYTLSLAMAMLAKRGAHEMRLLANGLYPDSSDLLRRQFAGLTPAPCFATYSHPLRAFSGHDGQRHDQIASALIHVAYQAVGADVILCASPFEGWCEEGVVPQAAGDLPSGLKVAVLYDFIPHLFPAQHLDNAPAYKTWYQQRLAGLKQYDLLLAISEATRNDAIALLDIEPDRVVTISGAADAHFRRLSGPALEAIDCSRFGITRPFILYTGNGDYRKNLAGMVAAYARLPAALRAAHQLVVNQVGDAIQFQRTLDALGLSDADVIVTGRITDDELLALYNRCTLFVFPSLYEGFGLPVLEAMACGAAVIAGDNSSISEVVGRQDMLFDAADPDSIAALMQRALCDDDWRGQLRTHGLTRATQFNWHNTAELAWQAIETALAKRRRSALAPSTAIPDILPALAVVPLANGMQGGQLATTLRQLARHFEIDVFADEPVGSAHAPYPRAALAARYQRYATALYIADTASLDPAAISLMRAAPGVLLLLDHGDTPAEPPSAHEDAEAARQILRDQGLQGLLGAQLAPAAARPYPLGRSSLEALRYLMLTSAAAGTPWHAPHDASSAPRHGLIATPSAADLPLPQLVAGIREGIAQDWRQAADHIAQAWSGAPARADQQRELAAHGARNLMLNRGQRLLIDVTQMARIDALSGIQRVVRNIARELCRIDGAPPIELVQIEHGRLVRANQVAAAILDLPLAMLPRDGIDIQPGDTLLMIDSSWEQYGEFLPIFDQIRRFGGRIVTVVYDLIPLRLPQYCSAGLIAVFRRWFTMAVSESDLLLCISDAVRADVAAYIAEQNLTSTHALQLAYWHLGADIEPAPSDIDVRDVVRRMTADTDSPLYLMVGTIEPRKGHDTALDAFDLLWAAGSTARLCLAGKEGWHVEALMARIRRHPELGRRLFFVERFSDAEINLCYAHAQGLIAASLAEGYGLPIVEAAQHQVPVLASDIPVFREVGGAGAHYFTVGDANALARLVTRFSALDTQERRRLASLVPIMTWAESAARALRLILPPPLGATSTAAAPAPAPAAGRPSVPQAAQLIN